MSKPSLYVATPCYSGEVTMTYHWSVMELARVCRERDIVFEQGFLSGCSSITHARNYLTTAFVKSTRYSHMLFIDSDMGFQAADILAMLDYPAHEVAAVLCPKREYNWRIIRDAVAQNPQIDPAHLAHIGGQYTGMFHLPPGVNSMTIGREPVEVAVAGTGIMMISRVVLERMLATGDIPEYPGAEGGLPIAEFFRAGIIDGGPQGEDYYFCNLARRHGATIWGFPGFLITHTGLHAFVGDLPGIVAHYDGPVQNAGG